MWFAWLWLVGLWISYPDLQLSLLGVQPVRRGLVVHGSLVVAREATQWERVGERCSVGEVRTTTVKMREEMASQSRII